jgi:lipopolysaccharide export system protein LptC
MAVYDNPHSRIVAWLKIALPLAALGILSTLFLFSRGLNPEDALPYAEVDLEEIAREARLSAPQYSGVTEDGAAVIVTAKSATPDPENAKRATASELHMALDAADGLRTELAAASGEIDTAAGNVMLDGGVRLQTSSGYTLTSPSMTSALARTAIAATGPVVATAPYGNITAGGMTLDAADPASGAAGKGTYVLIFNNGVKLIYQPEK